MYDINLTGLRKAEGSYAEGRRKRAKFEVKKFFITNHPNMILHSGGRKAAMQKAAMLKGRKG
ncbi:MAG: hypothetical protein F6K39_08320 [Okeania sp. SIO3B3]|nr:hypothetical protein [Okeania sp. SIO3B3]